MSPIPGANKGVDPSKIQAAGIASSKAFNFYREHMMGNRSQWSIIAASNQVWAEKVFPNLKGEEAVEALWDAIFKASRVTEEKDPIELIKWKHLYEQIEESIDSCENVANILEGVVKKYA